MIRDGKGGANTNKAGLAYESKVSIVSKIASIDGYSVKVLSKTASNNYKVAEIYFKGEFIAKCFQKYGFYDFLKAENIQWQEIISRQILPDDTLYFIMRETFYIIEYKFQKVGGSVDEKLQTCDFKKKQYQKLLKKMNLKVEYVYVLDSYFDSPKYRDVLDYVESVNCHYKFDEIPLAWFGLPIG